MLVKISRDYVLLAKLPMPKVEKTHAVKHRAIDMFDLVCDIERYPEFVPLCQSLSIRDERERDGKKLVLADMTMAYKMLSETFTTQVLMDRAALRVDVKYIEGPFRHLDNVWRFVEGEETDCVVHFTLDYELRSKMLALAAGTVFDIAFNQFVGAFEDRANAIYA